MALEHHNQQIDVSFCDSFRKELFIPRCGMHSTAGVGLVRLQRKNLSGLPDH
jgi:hypothetical protein